MHIGLEMTNISVCKIIFTMDPYSITVNTNKHVHGLEMIRYRYCKKNVVFKLLNIYSEYMIITMVLECLNYIRNLMNTRS